MDMLRLCVILLLPGFVRTTCSFPGAPAHSKISFTDAFNEGSFATYECDRGFELLGPSRRLCAEHGIWAPEGIPFCVLNVAAGKAPMQVSTEDGGVPQKALDGSTSDLYNPETCTLTKSEKVPWWYVNLLEPYVVQLVRLDFGKMCCGAKKQVVIVVRVGNNRPDLGTNPICNRYDGILEDGHPLFLPCNPPMPGAFVSVHIEVPSPTQLSLCEAFVYTDQALPIERCPQFRDQPPGSTATYNGKCYIFYNRQPANFKEAQSFCHSRDGTLVDESNPALQGFISWELWRRHRSDSNSQYWMGATRDPQDSTNWKWVNGKDVNLSFWNAPGGKEDCARFDGSKGWLWADTDCQAKLNFICQHQPTACGRPEQPPNSTMVVEVFDVGTSVDYSCDEGHLLVGPASRTCLNTGFYSDIPPVCKRIECGLPAEIHHGIYKLVNDTVTYLSHVQYYCQHGYEMVGRSRLVCDIDERWNGPPPRCDIVRCEDPPLIPNGFVDYPYNASVFGTVATYTCVAGYRVVGPHYIACSASGQWNDSAPYCDVDVSTTTSTTTEAAPTTTASHSTPRLVLPSRQRTSRPSSPAPFAPSEGRQTWPKSTTELAKPIEKTLAAAPNTQGSQTSHVPKIIVASHPRENHLHNVGHSSKTEQTPRVNLPQSVEGDHPVTSGARFNIGAVVALACFGVLIFLLAIVVTIIVLVKSRKRNKGKRYRHHVSPDCNTVASLDSSSSASRSGLNRYYRQAWEELHEAAGAKHGHRRHEREAPKDGSELVVSDLCPTPHVRDKRRHHHHHHHRDTRHPDWRSPHRSHSKPRY